MNGHCHHIGNSPWNLQSRCNFSWINIHLFIKHHRKPTMIAHCYFMLQFTFPIIYVSYGPAHFQNPWKCTCLHPPTLYEKKNIPVKKCLRKHVSLRWQYLWCGSYKCCHKKFCWEFFGEISEHFSCISQAIMSQSLWSQLIIGKIFSSCRTWV